MSRPSGGRNVRGGLILLSVGLAAGLAMSTYAFRPMVPVPPSLAHYDDLSRRLLRLAHIAAVMLPLINVVAGSWLDRVGLSRPAREVASWLLLLGAATLPCTLALEAMVPGALDLHLSAVPAIAFCVGQLIVSVGACREHVIQMEASHGSLAGDRATDHRHRRASLQATGRDV